MRAACGSPKKESQLEQWNRNENSAHLADISRSRAALPGALGLSNSAAAPRMGGDACDFAACALCRMVATENPAMDAHGFVVLTRGHSDDVLRLSGAAGGVSSDQRVDVRTSDRTADSGRPAGRNFKLLDISGWICGAACWKEAGNSRGGESNRFGYQ